MTAAPTTLTFPAEPIPNTLDTALTALRLLRESGMSAGIEWTQTLRRSVSFYFSASMGLNPFKVPPFPFANQCAIDASDEIEVGEISSKFPVVAHGSTFEQRRFELALARLNIAGTRRSIQDRLIDYWIALETLFAHDSAGEITYRCRTRISRYVATDFADQSRWQPRLPVLIGTAPRSFM